MADLPAGWIWASLNQVTSRITDGTHRSPENLPSGDYKYVTAKNIRPWGLDLSDISYVSSEDHAAIYARCPVERNDVLYIKDGATTGLAAINDLDEPFSMLSSVALLKPRKDVIDPYYLKYWLNSPRTIEAMIGRMTGTAIRRLTLTTLSSQRIAVPPLAEQNRIVAKIDSLTERTRCANAELAHLSKLAVTYKTKLLEAAFSGELVGEDKPGYLSLSSLVSGLRYGTAQKSYETAVGRPVLRIPNVNRGKIDLEILKYSELSDREYETLRLEVGDLLVVRSNGSADLVGLPAVVSESAAGMAYAGYLIRVRPKLKDVLPEFLALMLQSPQIRRKIVTGARSTSGVHNVNAKELAALPIPDFDISTQAKIVREVENNLLWLDSTGIDIRSAVSLLEKFDEAVLTKACAGGLVPQDPTETPASVASDPVEETPLQDRTKTQRVRALKEKAMPSYKNLEQVLAETNDWIPAQNAFQLCGIGDGSSTEDIEQIYAQLRDLHAVGRLESKVVVDDQNRKLHDLIRLRDV